MNYQRKYNRAIGIAEYIAQGHGIKETKEEFGVSKDTIHRDLIFLANEGYGEELKRNQRLYVKAKKELQIRQRKA